MLIELPALWLVVVNIVAWGVIHMAAAWVGTQLPIALFSPGQWCYRERKWEHGGQIYETLFAIRQWKSLLPDGAALFKKGFRKKRLAAREPAYVERFIRETCRGEAVHWVVLLCSLLFFLWNPWWVGVIMVIYALAANVPCIVTQRYNRIRLARLASRHR